jgi:hypothetical protein
MKKQRTLLVVIACITILAMGCARATVKKDYEKYKSIYVGWLDMQNWNYGAWGFVNRAVWLEEVKNLNVNYLQKYTGDYMKGWKVTGAASPGAAAPRDAETIVVRFTNATFNTTTSSVKCVMSFYNGASGRLLKQSVVESAPVVSHSAWGWASRSFTGGRLHDAMYNLAYEIQYKLNH